MIKAVMQFQPVLCVFFNVNFNLIKGAIKNYEITK